MTIFSFDFKLDFKKVVATPSIKKMERTLPSIHSKSEMIEGILCEMKKSPRSILKRM
jgi:hypothetical protein